MATVQYCNQVFTCEEGQTVLDVLLENGQDIPYSCKMGVCITCVMQLVEGEVPEQAQEGLRRPLVDQGQFLPCVCEPKGDIKVINLEQQDLFGPSVVRDVERLPKDICRIFLEPTTPLYYRAGQFMNLRREDGLARSYSIASVPSQDDRLEFHVKRLKGGEMSGWLMDDLKPGDHLGIQGPFGDCFYRPEQAGRGMLLVGNGTGLAPLIGIARDALASGHEAPICLYHGSQTSEGLYLGDDLRALAATHDNFSYVPCVSREAAPDGYRQGRADDVAFIDHADLKGWSVFLCGYPPMVTSAKDRSLKAGAHVSDIYADPYELKELRKAPRDETDQ